MSSLFGPATEDDRWRYDVHQLIERQAAQRGGTAVERPYSRGRESTYTEPAPLQAIQAARFVQAVADGRAKHFAQRARGDGHGWDVIGEALNLTEQAKDERRGRGELAFEMVAGAPPMRFDRVTCHWTCSTCGEFVTDNGPYNLHPEDQEEGHAADCSRFRQAVAEYEAALEE